MTDTPTRATTYSRVASLIFELAQAKTVVELAFYADTSEEVVEKYIEAFKEKHLVFIADWQWRPKKRRYIPKYALDLTGRRKDIPPPKV